MTKDIFVVGVSHHTAPLAVRERLAIQSEDLDEVLNEVRSGGQLDEAFLISTCNRVEVYGTSSNPAAGIRWVRSFFRQLGAPEPIEEHLYERWGTEAIEHAFRVTASLDSMVVGEPQILGQMKAAFEAANSLGAVGTLLGRCMTRAFGTAKRVRSETEIGAGSVSVSSAAAELARKIFGHLQGRRVLLVGAGEMGESTARALAGSGALLFVINRSSERAQRIAQANRGEPRGYEQLASEVIGADVVVTSTSSGNFILTEQLMRDVIRARRRRPLFLIDIAVPRNVDPRVGNLENVFLYDVDDLQHLAAEALNERKRAAEEAEAIVREEVIAFSQWRQSLDLTPTIVALRERFRDVVQLELQRTIATWPDADEQQRQRLERMGEAIVNKLLHQPLTRLKEGAQEPDGAALLDATQRLFELGQEPPHEQDSTEPAAASLRLTTSKLAPTGSGEEP